MNDSKAISYAIAVSLAAAVTLAGCGGGSGSATTDPTTSGSTKPTATAGVYKGTFTSTTTGQSAPVVAMVGATGDAMWMSADGRVWSGQMPATGTRFDVPMMGRTYSGATFPDGMNAGSWMMNVDHPAGEFSGHFAGSGDAGTFDLMLDAMWNRAASLQTLAGVYTRTTWTGYAMTMTVGTDGHLSGSDSRGCTMNGTVTVPDATHNLYALEATVSSCGALDGTYRGQGTLVDADAMRSWMSAMHPLEQGGHTHGSMNMPGGMGGMGGMGGGGMTYNTVPGGTSNLFMFALRNEQNMIMDALAR